LQNFCVEHASFVDHWRQTLERFSKKYGSVALWGGASKAVAFTGLLGDAIKYLSASIDINPAKQGCYLPKSGLPIISPAIARQQSIKAAVVVNPLYFYEVFKNCSDMGIQMHLIPLT
jgi:hypothetical protein